MTCDHCETALDEDDSHYLSGHGDLCSDCYHELGDTCQLCSEVFGEGEGSCFFLLKAEACQYCSPSEHPSLPGIYTNVQQRRTGPSMSVPLIGSPTFWRDEMRFVRPLPVPESEIDISGLICGECAKKHNLATLHEQCLEIDELAMMRAALLAQPRMTEGFEWASSNERWQTWMKHLSLDRDTQTGAMIRPWSPWIAVQHKGVTLYCLRSWRDAYHAGLDPEPEWRSNRAQDQALKAGRAVDAYTLPGYVPRAHDQISSEDDSQRRYRMALRHAIDKGIITAQGVQSFTPYDRDWYFVGRELRREWSKQRRWRLRYALRGGDVTYWATSADALRKIEEDHLDTVRFGEGKKITFQAAWKAALHAGWHSFRPKLARQLQASSH